MENIETILLYLDCCVPAIALKAKEKLTEKFKALTAVPELCEYFQRSNDADKKREVAKIILSHLMQEENWKSLPGEQQKQVTNLTQNTLRSASFHIFHAYELIFELMVTLQEYERSGGGSRNIIEDILKFFLRYKSTDLLQTKGGLNGLGTFSSTVHGRFVPQISALVSNDQVHMNEKMNVLDMGLDAQIPRIVAALSASAAVDPIKFTSLLNLFESIAIFAPKIMEAHSHPLFQLFLEMSKDPELYGGARKRLFSHITWWIRKNYETIEGQHLSKPIIEISSNFLKNGASDKVGSQSDGVPVPAYLIANLLLASKQRHSLVEYLMPLFDSAFKNDNNLGCKLGVLYLINRIAESGWDRSGKNDRYYWDWIKSGITDSNTKVMQLALWTADTFNRRSFGSIDHYASEMLPIFFELFRKYYGKRRNGIAVGMIVSLLTMLCDKKGIDGIAPHLHNVDQVLDWIENSKDSTNLRDLFRLVWSIIDIVENRSQSFTVRCIELAKMFLLKSDIRSHAMAIATLSKVVRSAGVESFMPHANEVFASLTAVLIQTSDVTRLGIDTLELIAAFDFGKLTDPRNGTAAIVVKFVAFLVRYEEAEEYLVKRLAFHPRHEVRFPFHFGRLFSVIENCRNQRILTLSLSEKLMMHEALLKSVKILNSKSVEWFGGIFAIFADGLLESNEETRRTAALGLVELLSCADEKLHPAADVLDSICKALNRWDPSNEDLLPLRKLLDALEPQLNEKRE